MTHWANPGRSARRHVAYNKHRLAPQLTLPSRTAWALAFEAGRRRMTVADLIVAICSSWERAWEEQLGETDLRRFVESIPHHRGPYGPRAAP